MADTDVTAGPPRLKLTADDLRHYGSESLAFVAISRGHAMGLADSLDEVCVALEGAIATIRAAEKDTNFVSGDPYGESYADELERVLTKARGEQA